MMIRYSNGRAVEAVLLARSQKAMRVAIRGCEDVAELSEVNGTWVTEDGEPVQVEYEWELQGRTPLLTVDDCLCPPELAARLLGCFSLATPTLTVTARIEPVDSRRSCRSATFVWPSGVSVS